MASLWRKKGIGIGCITYREDGKHRVRSLRTTDKREAIWLRRAVDIVEKDIKDFKVALRKQDENKQKGVGLDVSP